MMFLLALALALNLVETSIVLLILAFTPSNSLVRPALFPLLLALAIHTVSLNRDSFPSKLQASLVTLHTAGVLLQYLDFGLISQWSFSARGPTSSRGGQRNINLGLAASKAPEQGRSLPKVWARLRWGFFATTAWRAPSTPWEVKNVPPFDPREPSRVPTRGRFLGRSMVTLALCLVVIDMISLAPKADSADGFTWQKVSLFARLKEISAKEVAARVFISLVGWISIYCIIQAVYCSVAITAVAIDVTSVNQWPPIFGSVKECYSIRQFWGTFWHQTVRQKIASPAYYITYSLLGLPKSGIVARYTYIFLAFGISGLLHTIEEYGGGVPLHQSGSLRFYCSQALGIMFEDAVQAIFRSLTGRRHNRWTRAIGYVWIFFWMGWSSPAWFYPKLQNNNGSKRDQILPFSVLGPCLSHSISKQALK